MSQDGRGMTKFNFRLSKGLAERLRVVAEQQGRSRSAVLVEIVGQYVKWAEKKEATNGAAAGDK